jgi:hypothetical protein
VKYLISFNLFLSWSFQVQGEHRVYKVCIDRGETTSGKLKRDSVESSSAEVQGVHRRELYLEFREEKTTEGSVEAMSGGH